MQGPPSKFKFCSPVTDAPRTLESNKKREPVASVVERTPTSSSSTSFLSSLEAVVTSEKDESPTVGGKATEEDSPTGESAAGTHVPTASSDGTSTPAIDTPIPPEENGNLPDAVIDKWNQKLDDVYGDHIHHNPGTHLNGGIKDDDIWQDRMRHLLSFQSRLYQVPTNKTGKQFVAKLTELMDGIVDRKWNSE